MQKPAMIFAAFAVTLVGVVPQPLAAQDWTRREFPLAPPNSNRNFVAPYFDGFYENEDGTFTISFGFMNRNDSALVEIPLGPDNFIEPAQFDGVQPTSFPVVRYSGFGGPRERGAFGVVVPADFEGDVWWTLTTDGYTTRVPGRLESPGEIIKGAYELSTTPMAQGSLRPSIRFSDGGPDGFGIEGVEHPEELGTSVGEPVEVRFWTFDRGERELGSVNMTLWKHRGPAGAVVSFESLVEAPPEPEGREMTPARARLAAARAARGGGGRPPGPGPVTTGQSISIPIEGAEANVGRFRATFDTPGEYVIRIRIDNFGSGDSSPGNQCCWSNAYVKVSVSE